MDRRQFIKSAALSGAGIGMMTKSPVAYSLNKIERNKVLKRKILVWSHIYLDFLGNDDSVRKEFSMMRDSGIALLLMFIHSHPEENQSWYNSSLYGFVKQDKLSRLLQIAKEVDLEIHPLVGSITDTGLSDHTRVKRSYASGKPGGHSKDGRFCASWEGNRMGGIKISLDVLDHHKVSGIHLDYIRYIDTGIGLKWPCQCEACKQNYLGLFGKEMLTEEDFSSPGVLYKYLQFRNSNILDAVLQHARLARQYQVQLSMAARANYFKSALVEGQDWVGWAKKGLFDFICPMNYTLDRAHHKKMLKQQLELIDGQVPIYSGLGRKWSGGENSMDEVIRQAEDALTLGASGISIFHYNGFKPKDFKILKRFRRSIE